MTNLAYPRLRAAAERVLAATDPGEEMRLGQALHELSEVVAVIDRMDSAPLAFSCAELGCDHSSTRPPRGIGVTDKRLRVHLRRIGRTIEAALHDPRQVLILLIIYAVVACIALLVFG